MAENEKNQSARAPAAKGGQGRAARPAENTNGIKQKAPAAQKRPSGTAQKQNGNKSQPQAGKKKPQEAAQKTAQAQKTEHTQKASQKNQQPKQSRGRQKQPSPVAAQELALKQRRAQKPQKQQQNLVRKTPVRIISLGGLNEIGKNMTVIECANDMFLIDCGLAFPDDDMLGVDIVIPDFTYIERNIDKLRGVVLTHGHEDHIGALPYFLAQFKVPVYGTRLTLGLVEGKLLSLIHI